MKLEAAVIFLGIGAFVIGGFLHHVEKRDASNIFMSIGVGMLIIFGFLNM